MKIGGYRFEGPYSSADALEDRAGVYAILDHRGGRYYVLDVGESATVKTRVKSHDRSGCWKKNASGDIEYAVLYTPHKQQLGRVEIEQAIRKQYNPICGER